jgi:predicted enzyme related to lactoylglutathione lyase
MCISLARSVIGRVTGQEVTMPGPLVGVTIDCSDLERSATFWSAALGFADRGTDPDARFRTLFGPRREGGLHHVSLQRVPEPKPDGSKNRVHLDLYVPDLDAEVERLYRMGASFVRRDAELEGGFRSVVMADPDGNEFCLIEMPDRR